MVSCAPDCNFLGVGLLLASIFFEFAPISEILFKMKMVDTIDMFSTTNFTAFNNDRYIGMQTVCALHIEIHYVRSVLINLGRFFLVLGIEDIADLCYYYNCNAIPNVSL